MSCPEGPSVAIRWDRRTLFVGAVLVAFAIDLLWFVHGYAVDMPLGDEIRWLSYATGDLRVDLKWLWSEHNNHRVLFPRLLYLALWNVLGPGFRWGMYFGAFGLTATATLFVIAAKKLRGHLSYTDAFFPLLWLSRGHAELLLSSFNSTCNILTVLVISLLVFAISISPDPLAHRGLRNTIAPAIVVAPLTTATGALVSASLVPWLCVGLWRRWRRERRWSSEMVVGSALAVYLVAVISAYVATLDRHNATGGARLSLQNVKQALTMPFGTFLTAYPRWWPVFFLFLVSLLVLLAVASLARLRSGAVDAQRLFALWSIVAGFFLTALLVGVARTVLGVNAGLQTRYGLVLSPLLGCVYLIAQLVLGQSARELFQMVLFFVMACVAWPTAEVGNVWREERHAQYQEIAEAVRAGWTSADLEDALTTHNFVLKVHGSLLVQVLKDHHLGPFRRIDVSTVTAERSGDLLHEVKPSSSPLGNVESCQPRLVSFEISGWLICPGGRPADELLALATRGGARSTGPWVPRPDVKAIYGVEQVGFRLWLPRWATEEPIAVVARCGQALHPVSGSPIRCKP
jgi:hypothetical protein